MRVATQPLSSAYAEPTLAASTRYTSVPEHDVQEIVAKFSRPEIRKVRQEVQERSARSIGSILTQKSNSSDFNSATQGGVTFRRVDPLRETKVVADERLQQRLEVLCQTLRAKY